MQIPPFLETGSVDGQLSCGQYSETASKHPLRKKSEEVEKDRDSHLGVLLPE